MTNLLERLFVQERWRLNIFPNAFGEKPLAEQIKRLTVCRT